ncbi:hypothetical protein RN001_003407 [Aquatica leii]|uniref:Uncharacterized protein n=1 Tax=Aquatica leii TaxID=1421715 RepID=A0AAN7PR37_9COLE|nr:hypothetical protein RN001_003407 [Aquatica leii]
MDPALKHLGVFKRNLEIELDFNTRFVTYEDKIYSRLSILTNAVIAEANLRKITVITDEDVDLTLKAILTLPYLLAPVTLKNKRKSGNWRPSRSEISESFFLHIESFEELQQKKSDRLEKLKSCNLTLQPFGVICGPLNNAKYLAVVNDIDLIHYTENKHHTPEPIPETPEEIRVPGPSCPYQTPKEVKELPQAPPRKRKKTGRKPTTTKVLTDTPNKAKIKSEHEKRQEQKNTTAEKNAKKNLTTDEMSIGTISIKEIVKQKKENAVEDESDSDNLAFYSSSSSEITDTEEQIEKEREEEDFVIEHIHDDLRMRQRNNSSAIALDAFQSPSTTFTSTRQENDDCSKVAIETEITFKEIEGLEEKLIFLNLENYSESSNEEKLQEDNSTKELLELPQSAEGDLEPELELNVDQIPEQTQMKERDQRLRPKSVLKVPQTLYNDYDLGYFFI